MNLPITPAPPLDFPLVFGTNEDVNDHQEQLYMCGEEEVSVEMVSCCYLNLKQEDVVAVNRETNLHMLSDIALCVAVTMSCEYVVVCAFTVALVKDRA